MLPSVLSIILEYFPELMSGWLSVDVVLLRSFLVTNSGQ